MFSDHLAVEQINRAAHGRRVAAALFGSVDTQFGAQFFNAFVCGECNLHSSTVNKIKASFIAIGRPMVVTPMFEFGKDDVYPSVIWIQGNQSSRAGKTTLPRHTGSLLLCQPSCARVMGLEKIMNAEKLVRLHQCPAGKVNTALSISWPTGCFAQRTQRIGRKDVNGNYEPSKLALGRLQRINQRGMMVE